MNSKIKFLVQLGIQIQNDPLLSEIIQFAYIKNNWFTPEYCRKSIDNIIKYYLQEDLLEAFLSHYPKKKYSGNIALILAGNIPLVGFHDLLCAYLVGENIQVKLSHKDEVLMKYFIEKLNSIDPNANINITERLENIGKIIATGSENTNRYFEYYFRKYPHLLRSNRTSIAVLDGKETDEQLDAFMDDIFLYFGLGCRNVSKIFIPEAYPLNKIFEKAEKYKEVFNHQKFMNNFEYHKTLYLLSKIPFLTNDFFILKEDIAIFSPISILFYEYYTSLDTVEERITLEKNRIQCILSNCLEGATPFGDSQMPTLSDFADGVDTIDFLLNAHA